MLGAELIHQPVAGDAQPCLEGVFRIVDAGMNHAAVARAGSHAQLGVLLNKEYVIRPLRNSMRNRATDYAAADNKNVGLVHAVAILVCLLCDLCALSALCVKSFSSLSTLGNRCTRQSLTGICSSGPPL